MPLTGGPHLDPVVLMCLADDILSPDAEAVVPRITEGVGQVVSSGGHRHGVALSFLQGEALGLESPAHGQRRAAREPDGFSDMGQQGRSTDQVQGKPGGLELQCPFQDRTPSHPSPSIPYSTPGSTMMQKQWPTAT